MAYVDQVQGLDDMPSRQLISFSLFGPIPKYNIGAVENMRLARVVYPGWKVRFYCDAEATATDELAAMGAEIVSFVRPARLPAALCMAWRFLAAADPDVDYAIFRDSDSRLNVREKVAVDAWLQSGRMAHVMRDHPHHVGMPILAGMWGIRGGALMDMPRWIAERQQWGPCATNTGLSYSFDDMILLQEQVWPRICNDVLQHTSVANPWGGQPFPPHPPYQGFVGEQIEILGL
jgi:hypothetical protein